MKHDQIRSVAHNIASSLASGTGLLIGMYEMNVFGEAASSPEGFIKIDFLTGTTSGGRLLEGLSPSREVVSRRSS